MKYETNWLSHHGVRGQRWGQRRYQEEDGSLTALGREHYGVGEAEDKKQRKVQEKERYKRGKEYSKERDQIAGQKRKEILDKDAEYQKARKEVEDADWEYETAKDDFERESAQFHRGEAHAKLSMRYDKADAKATKHANDFMTKKYGDTALSDIDHYKTQSEKKFNRFVGGTIAALSVAVIGAQVAMYKKSTNRFRS
jgi:hypothetical protein